MHVMKEGWDEMYGDDIFYGEVGSRLCVGLRKPRKDTFGASDALIRAFLLF